MASAFEKYTTGDDTNGSFNSNIQFDAQTFTIGTVGDNLTFNISSVDVKIKGGDADDTALVSVQGVKPDGTPDGVSISTGTSAAIGETARWMNVTMTNAALKASTQYCLIVNPGAGASYTIGWREDESSASYAGGSLWRTNDTGGTWAEESTKDKMFQINGGDYAGTLCTLADARNKGGANASSTATNESLVSDYVKQAEGIINAVTRFDWVAQYASLTDEVKFILNQTASDLAAIYIITYDMSGFTDRVEAETMVNVYRESVARGLSLLRNQEVKSFMVSDT
jgi:hypothetical protein